MVIAIAVMLFYNRLWVSREKKADAASKNQINRLALILQTGKLRLWTFNINKRRYYPLSESGDQTQEYQPIDFAQFFNRDDFEDLRKIIFDMSDDKPVDSTIRIRGAVKPGEEPRQYEVMLSVAERDSKGHVKILLGVQRDITDMLKREQEVNQLLMRYHTVFNSALTDMIYYDKDGRLSNINDKACKSFNIDDRRGLLLSDLRIEDNPIVFDSINFHNPDDIHTTALLNVSELEKQGYQYIITRSTMSRPSTPSSTLKDRWKASTSLDVTSRIWLSRSTVSRKVWSSCAW